MTMTKRRQMTPDDWTDETLQELPPIVRLTYLGLRMFADDEGRESATATRIRAALYPLDEDIDDATIDEHLLLLEDLGYLVLYTAGRRIVFSLTVWPRVDGAKASSYPPPPPRSVRTPSGSTPDSVAVVGEREEGEETGERGAREERGTASGPTREPRPFCSQHPDGTERPCGGCATARMRHELWVRAQREGSTPTFEDRG